MLTCLSICLLLLHVNSPVELGLLKPAFLSSSAIAVTSLSQAQMITPQQALERIFTTPQVQADWFAASFLQQVSATQIEGVIQQITQGLGAYQSVTETADGFEVRFARGTVLAQIQLDGNGQIVSFLLQPASAPISLEEAAATIENASYPASLLVLKNGAELVAVNAGEPLAVGSAFKLAVLAALQNRIQAGELTWDTVVELQPAWQSLPSGMLQDWPATSALTIETLAILMISISDNTATDALINLVGRENIEALTPRNRPFLSTREFFALKNPANVSWLERYRRGDLAQQRQVLSAVPELPLPSASLFAG